MAIASAPGAVPLVGNLPLYLRDRLGFFTSCGNGTGSVVRCRLAGDGYLLNEPQDIRHVLVRNRSNYVKARRVTGPRARYPNPSTLLTSAGEEHRRKRIAIQRVFRRTLVDSVEERARANAGALAASWGAGAEIEAASAMRSLAQRNILEVLFGTEGGPGLDAIAEASAARRSSIERTLFSIFPLPEYLPNRANAAYVRATRRLGAIVKEAIAARRAEPREDIVSELLELELEDGGRLTDAEVHDEVLTLTLTGYDSVSEALAWTLHLMAERPEVGDAVAAGDDAYATSVVRESLRLYPPTWLFARVALEDDPLPSGSRLPAGARVYLCPWVVHRNPRLWPEPERFDPARFGAEAGGERERYAYFPFGGGPHVCIAETVAMGQVVAVLRTIAGAHALRPAAPAPVPVGGLTLTPGGPLRLHATRRAA